MSDMIIIFDNYKYAGNTYSMVLPLTEPTLDDIGWYALVTAIYIYKIKFQIEMLLAMCIMNVISIHLFCSQCTKSLSLHWLFNKTKLIIFVNFVTDCQSCSSVQRVRITPPSMDLEKLKLIPLTVCNKPKT